MHSTVEPIKQGPKLLLFQQLRKRGPAPAILHRTRKKPCDSGRNRLVSTSFVTEFNALASKTGQFRGLNVPI
jgi:hypothetical protein